MRITKNDSQPLIITTTPSAGSGAGVQSSSMTRSGDQAPATKQDLQEVLSIIMDTMQDMEKRMLATMEEKMEEKIGKAIAASENRMLAAMEHLEHNVAGMLKDVRSNDYQIADHERRITHLEERAGMAA